MTRSNDETEAPFGNRKRDWTLLWRGLMLGLGLFSAAGVAIGLYAGSSYIKEQAGVIIVGTVQPLQDLPPRVKRLEEIAVERQENLKDWNQWRSKKDDIDTRLTVLLENQAKQLERQQTLIDGLAQRVK